MKNQIVFALLATLLLITSLKYRVSHQKKSLFQDWKIKHAKQYSSFESFYRQKIFFITLKQIEEHNQRAQYGQETYTMALNAFSDLTFQQFSEYYLDKSLKKTSSFVCTNNQPPASDLPKDFDWSAKSAINAVRKQSGKCASGYAISAAQSLQANYYITLHQKMQLSPQQIIDCSKSYANQGCKGGSPLNSFEYIKEKGIASEASYPYKGEEKPCSYSIQKKAWELLNCVKVTPQKQIAIKAAIYKNPTAAAINVSKGLKSYSQGLFKPSYLYPCKSDPDHWMLMVGYGHDASKKKDYWKLKNSWGADWGQQGYLFIQSNGDGQGFCKVQTQLYFAQ